MNVFYISNAGEVRESEIFLSRFSIEETFSNGWLYGKISPPLLGQKYNVSGDITSILLAPRYDTGALGTDSWPLYFNIFLIPQVKIQGINFETDTRYIENSIAFPTEQEMNNYIKKFYHGDS